ncbi:hypothetical protein AC480_02075 [miscellaneous Crenarchaeota group archaeon SMTZ1-55]|nr:MAG: hypothetical protein AC480_02075 [miscellaneous Crenarchaeota group archaeon SMTZ1-55]
MSLPLRVPQDRPGQPFGAGPLVPQERVRGHHRVVGRQGCGRLAHRHEPGRGRCSDFGIGLGGGGAGLEPDSRPSFGDGGSGAQAVGRGVKGRGHHGF